MSNRELDQLFLVARHYLSQADRLARRNPSILAKTLHDVTSHHTQNQLKSEELVLAHLASSAIRLSTICEKRPNILPGVYRNTFYKQGSRKSHISKSQVTAQITEHLDEHIHFLFRDNVAHEENGQSDMAKDRFDILMQVTIRQVLSALDSCASKVRAAIESV